MVSKMAKFLLDVAENNKLLDEYKSNPEKVMSEAGLSKEEKDAIIRKDIDKIQQFAFVKKVEQDRNRSRMVIVITIEHDWVNVFQTNTE